MKALFYIGIIGLLLFEVANVYFIMPMPGSQRMTSIDLAYFLYSWRWAFRTVFGLLLFIGLFSAFRGSKWLALAALLLVAIVSYAFNFRMSADHMFYQPGNLQLKPAEKSVVKPDREVLGVVLNGQAKAYPIQYIGYHHQVLDTIGGQPVMVTYCTVCRTGRVFQRIVNGKPETFRLVGMDHFNAMFEDATTGSWWRQANGESIAGQLKGDTLPEVFSEQMTLKKWLILHPNSLIMQPDTTYNERYVKMANYERGKGGSELTQTDSLSWRDKSWVVGLTIGDQTKAYDWNRLKRERLIHDTFASRPILLVLADDNRSFFAYQRPTSTTRFSLQHDTLVSNNQAYVLTGKAIGQEADLTRIPAHQEFWHSWRTFHPGTVRY
ncbi:DUF3179 domain-containing (seleno)protein [Spirosoma validum]|uniref:DUF3179 domain-containing protein n=1 Tax=Spirosoma validum TaxID=2771355 RepID=A0A927GDU8_9BACT|nr:DUF3179 domain-containing (seleno)protein [Spirosoma validum]MBD2754104.1 DUF3179 domain-containing protein [Spirosoma validum]